MPIAKIQLPDGRIAKFEVPEGTTPEQVMAFAQSQMNAPKKAAYDPTEGMSTTEKALAGIGKAFYDVGRGAGQLVGLVSRKDIEEARKLDAALMNTDAGRWGNIAGNVAIMAPTALIPGANTLTGAAAIGAASGLLQPSTSTKETLTNVGVGGVTGPAALLAGRAVGAAYQGGKALVEPFYKSGQDKIAARTLQRFAQDPQAAAAGASQATGTTVTGAQMTAAEASRDAGLAQLQRSLQSTDPTGFGNALAERLAANNSARVSALQNIARTADEREAAVKAVEKQAQQLYGDAFKESVPVTPALQRLASRPSVQKAEARAIGLADELGIPFQARLADMRPKYIPVDRNVTPSMISTVDVTPGMSIPLGNGRVTPSSVIEHPTTNSLGMLNPAREVRIPGDSRQAVFEVPEMVTPKTVRVQPDALPQTYMEIPPVESVPVRDMHTLKMGMDALLSDPTMGIAGREAAAVAATRNKLLDLLPQSYQTARQAYIDMNKPVNQMDIGKRLLERFSSAGKDLEGNPSLRSEAFNRALQNEGQLIKQATGVKGVTSLDQVMTPEQISAIRGVADELGLQAAVAKAGMAPGSPTAQNLASQNVLRQLLGPTGLPQSWAENTLLTTLMRPAQFVAKAAEPKITNRLAQAMLNPQEAAALLEMANNPTVSQRFGAQVLPWLAPASVGVQRAEALK